MNKLFRFAVIVAVVSVAGAAQAATVIDFEGLAPSTVITTQYNGVGADFTGATILTAGVNLNPNYVPVSGVNVIYDDPSNGGVIRVDAVGGMWDFAGGYVTGNTVVTMTAYDAADNALGSDATAGANFIGSGGTPNDFLSVSSANIAYVIFSDSGNTFTIDDFQFNQVPEPLSLAVWSVLCLAGIGLIRKYRQ